MEGHMKIVGIRRKGTRRQTITIEAKEENETAEEIIQNLIPINLGGRAESEITLQEERNKFEIKVSNVRLLFFYFVLSMIFPKFALLIEVIIRL